jgi:hypothetical protein
LKTVPALKGPKPALDFRKAGLEGLPRPGNPVLNSATGALTRA